MTMNRRIAVSLAAALAASSASANLIQIPDNVPVCPPPSYTSTNIPHVNNQALALHYGPTPAGQQQSGKCGIGEIRAAAGVCPIGVLSHYAYDIFDLAADANPPANREFRQALHVNSYTGIPVGGRVKLAELSFSSGEFVSFYLDRRYASTTDMTVVYRECDSVCPEVEVGRFYFQTGLEPIWALPMKVTWTTGSPGIPYKAHLKWSFGTDPQNPSPYQGVVMLRPGAQELTFSNGIVNGSCAGSEGTLVRFVEPRFVDLAGGF